MKKFCDCNGVWESEITSPSLVFDESVFRFILDVRDDSFDDECPICFEPFWYDADYENMMFDLKRMNEQ